VLATRRTGLGRLQRPGLRQTEGVTGLLPSRDAFAFGNSWPSQPALAIDTPVGTIPIGNAAGGLCGGMVYAVLDYWHAGQAPQPLARPALGEPLYRFIVRRLLDSWDLPAGVLQYYQWMLAPDGDRAFEVLGRRVVAERGLAWRTVVEQWPGARDDLDSGVPVPLGLVTMRTADPLGLAQNHQVLAYGYRREGAAVTVQVYDPNSGPRDDVAISFSDADPHRGTAFDHNIDIGHPVRGFFRTAYSPAEPPAAADPRTPGPAGRAPGPRGGG
jgi:hypothetical protein